MNRVINFILFIIVFSCTSPSDPEIAYINIDNFTEWNLEEKELFNSLNTFRSSMGLPTLTPSKECKGEADIRNETNIEIGTATHTGYSSTVSRLTKLGYTTCVSEVVAYGYKTVEATMSSLENSPSHYNIISSSCVEYAGASVMYDLDGNIYYTVVFAK